MINFNKGIESVPGFSYAAVKCGIRYSDRLDYGIIVSDKPCNGAGVFTTNKIYAAPVRLCRQRIHNTLRVILVNATNANATTGEEGFTNALELTGDIASKLGISPDEILMASTGVIGHQLPVKRMLSSHDELLSGLSPQNGPDLSRAIMTTDTVPKNISISFDTTRGTFTIAGIAKGAGMIAPNMATLLVFIVTDTPMAKDKLDSIFKETARKTLNCITIDGDMSTNDSAIILSPVSDEPLVQENDILSFKNALEELMYNLARLLVLDGEGVTKVVSIKVTGASDTKDANKIARSVAESLLVKTALFGNDPNWGRIAAAAGYSGAQVEEKSLSIYYEDIPLLINGVPCKLDLAQIKPILEQKEFTISVDVGIGSAEGFMLTSDISYDYVKINAEYTT